ncbi:hypothetical protein FB45DRAFT_683912, partial [Roridomyces roridus]
FAPVDETATEVFRERCILVGSFIGAVGFGIHFILFIQCVNAVYARRQRQVALRTCGLLGVICILFILGAIGNSTHIVLAGKTFIDDRNFPGGPGAYAASTNDWSAVVTDSVCIVNTWVQDAILLYRFWVLCSCNYFVVALPLVGFLASIVISAMRMAEMSEQGNSFWSSFSAKLAISFWTMSISTTLILTSLIAGRLLYMRYRHRRLMGPNSDTTYITITALLVESAALYSINAIFVLITYALKSPVLQLGLPLLGQTQSIAPLLIILRVTQAQAWSPSTATDLST